MTGVFLCTCQQKNGAAWADSVAKSLPGVLTFSHHTLCAGKGIGFAAARVRQRKLEKVLLAGCAALQSQAYAARLSASAGSREAPLIRSDFSLACTRPKPRARSSVRQRVWSLFPYSKCARWR